MHDEHNTHYKQVERDHLASIYGIMVKSKGNMHALAQN